MAAFDTGWVWTTDMYLNIGQYVRASGNAYRNGDGSVHVDLTLWNKIDDNSYYSWNSNACYGAANGYTGWQRIKPAASSYSRGAEYASSTSFNFSAGATSTSAGFDSIFAIFNSAESGNIGGTKYLWTVVTFDQWVSSPTGLNVSSIVRNVDGFTANVSISGWGNGSGSRYRELQVWTNSDSGLVEPRRYQSAYGDSTSGNITVNNSSNGSLNIQPNTMYVVGAYASNGSANTGSQRFGQYTTIPASPVFKESFWTDRTVGIELKILADGGRYSKNVYYKIDNGSWTLAQTVTGGSAKSVEIQFDVMDFRQHTIYFKNTTDAGDSAISSTTIQRPNPPQLFYCSANGQAKIARDMYCSVNGSSKKVKKLYASVNGVTKLVHEEK